MTHPVDDQKVADMARQLHIPQDEYIEAAHKVPIRDEASVKASAYLLQKIITDLINVEYAKKMQEKYIQELDMLAKKDSLTGLYNNKYCINFVETLLFENKPFSLFILDLDKFKSVNDTYGHVFGDRVLTSFSNVLKSFLPTNAIAGRYGGDEFVIIAPLVGKLESNDLAAEIKHALSQIEFEEVPGFTLTASIGISNYPLDGRTTKQLYESADVALYESKKLGGGQAINSEHNVSYSRAITRSILDRIPCVVVVFHRTKDGQLVREYISKNASYFTGKQDNHDADLTEIMSIVHPDDLPWVSRRVHETVKNGEGLDEIYRVVSAQGKVSKVHHVANAVNHPDGSCTFYAVYTEVID